VANGCSLITIEKKANSSAGADFRGAKNQSGASTGAPSPPAAYALIVIPVQNLVRWLEFTWLERFDEPLSLALHAVIKWRDRYPPLNCRPLTTTSRSSWFFASDQRF
jgi:hypothetical protein